MSLAPYIFRPLTPPESNDAAGQQRSHMRNVSAASYFTSTTSPEYLSKLSSPPVYRQCGPTLLPKIRTQSNQLKPAGQTTKIHKRAISTASNISTYNNVRPPMYRSQTEPVQDSFSLMSPVSMPAQSRASSLAPCLTVKSHSRNVSRSSTIDEATLHRYGYPTYKTVPQYVTQPTPSYVDIWTPPLMPTYLDVPQISFEGTFDMPVQLDMLSRPTSLSPPPSLEPSLMSGMPFMDDQGMIGGPVLPTTSLVSYLTQPTQPINLVRQLTFTTGRGLSSYYWWDVRNIRPWTSFTLEDFNSIPDMMTLLNFPHLDNSFPQPPASNSSATPSSEADLAVLISKLHFPKVNAACQLSLGGDAPYLYLAPPAPASSNPVPTAHPTFLASYPSENQFTLEGTPRGRIVGLAKSFDTFNTAMRNEGGHGGKVKYLRALAHLQKCMRDHSCRYGFIITEIELVCVRAGSDKYGNPYFGYVEVSDAIPLKESNNLDSDLFEAGNEDVSMTASLALYFLLMLSKKVPLPGQLPCLMDVGGITGLNGVGGLSRQRVLPDNEALKADARFASTSSNDDTEDEDGDVKEDFEKRLADGRDAWMPDAQTGEKRDAKTARGWVFPSDPWHKREGGRRARRA